MTDSNKHHKCVEWIKGRCTDCDGHYTDYIDQLHAHITELSKRVNRLQKVSADYDRLLDIIEQYEQALDDILDLWVEPIPPLFSAIEIARRVRIRDD